MKNIFPELTKEFVKNLLKAYLASLRFRQSLWISAPGTTPPDKLTQFGVYLTRYQKLLHQINKDGLESLSPDQWSTILDEVYPEVAVTLEGIHEEPEMAQNFHRKLKQFTPTTKTPTT